MVALSAIHGESVEEISQQGEISEEAVWNMLERLTTAFEGRQPREQVETGGLGSDTDPGSTGGYGDTGFGSIENDPPYPTPEEPRQES